MMPATFLYDDVHRWTYDKPKHANIGLPHLGEGVERYMRKYRTLVKQAKRFYLDEGFIETALTLSYEIDKVQHWLNIARLPFPVVWMEYDTRHKVSVSVKSGHTIKGPDDDYSTVQPRTGYLMQEIDKDSGTWVMSEFVDKCDKDHVFAGVAPEPMGWWVAPEGNVSALPGISKIWGSTAEFSEDGDSDTFERIALGSTVPLPWARHRIISLLEPTWGEASLEATGTIETKVVRDFLVDRVQHCARETRGVIRFLITVLALLNQAPNVKHIHAGRAGYRPKGMHRLPYLGHSTVTIELPKTKPMIVLARSLDKAAKDRRHYRAHHVRGHFRVAEYGKRPDLRCDHLPTMVEDGLGICTRCERLIRWVPHHTRGDATLGWVEQDYHLTTGGKR